MSENSVLKIIRGCLYAMVILVPLFFWKWTMNPFIVVKSAIFQSLAGIIIFLWVALVLGRRLGLSKEAESPRFDRRRFSPRFTPLTIGVVVFMLVLTISAFFGEDLMMSLWSQEVRTIGIVALWIFTLFFVALSSLGDELKWKNVWFASLVASLFSALGALLTFLPDIGQFFLRQDDPRPGSSFGNPTFLAGYLLFHVFLGIYVWYETRSSAELGGPASYSRRPGLRGVARVMPWLALIIALVDAFAIFKTETRGDIGGLIVGLFIIIFLLAIRYQRTNAKSGGSASSRLEADPSRFSGGRQSFLIFKNVWLWILIIVIAFGGVFYFTRSASFWMQVPGFDRIQSFTTVRSEFENRIIAWRSAAQSFSVHPVFGFGWENFNLAFQRHYDPALLSNNFGETYWDKPHNVLIEYAITSGIVGLLAYLGIWALLLYELKRSREGSIPKIIFFGMLAAYFIQNLVIFDTIGTYLMFFLVLAYIDVRYKGSPNAILGGPASDREEAGPPHGGERSSSSRVPFAYPALVVSLIPIFFLNWPMVYAAGREYWGPNYYLNKLPAESVSALNEALAAGTPYRDDIRLTFANVVKGAYESQVEYPDVANLQKRVEGELQKVIDHHPRNYLFYATLADFKNTFYEFDAGYLKDAEALEKKALELSPNRQQVYYIIGKTKVLEGDLKSAYDALKVAVDLNPSAGDPHFYLGIIAYQLHDVPTGDREIGKALELNRKPRTIAEATTLGDIMGDEKQDYESAIRYYAWALKMRPSVLQENEINLKIAVAYYLWGKYPEAKVEFERLSTKIDFRTVPIWSQLEPVFNGLGIKLPAPSSSGLGTPKIEITPVK